MKSTLHEYSILYTQRLFQKDKKWIDGILRYYKFNNKLEILDIDGILIKQDFKIVHLQVGHQYTFSNVLIEIVDYNGSFERDIDIVKGQVHKGSMVVKTDFSSKPSIEIDKPSRKPGLNIMPKKPGLSRPKNPLTKIVNKAVPRNNAGLNGGSISTTHTPSTTKNFNLTKEKKLTFKVVEPLQRRVPRRSRTV